MTEVITTIDRSTAVANMTTDELVHFLEVQGNDIVFEQQKDKTTFMIQLVNQGTRAEPDFHFALHVYPEGYGKDIDWDYAESYDNLSEAKNYLAEVINKWDTNPEKNRPFHIHYKNSKKEIIFMLSSDGYSSQLKRYNTKQCKWELVPLLKTNKTFSYIHRKGISYLSNDELAAVGL